MRIKLFESLDTLEIQPGERVKSIRLNRNLILALVYDKHNQGPRVLLACGNQWIYDGGITELINIMLMMEGFKNEVFYKREGYLHDCETITDIDWTIDGPEIKHEVTLSL